ncbi:MAG: tRNA (guanine(10)-N(2))-dimethyltransferase [Candidatus Bathyarchaeia archaeon]
MQVTTMDAVQFQTRVVKEGEAFLVVPLTGAPPSRGPAGRSRIFYNSSAALSRDISVLALKTYASGKEQSISIADPLTGCGARAIRYAREGPERSHVWANDLNSDVVALAKQAAILNKVEGRVTFSSMDARVFLTGRAASGERFDFIDLDPFGSPAPFLQAAASALRRGGVLALGATDLATLSGLHPRTCIARYWARPLKTEYHHEVAARILIGFAARTLAGEGLGAHPLSTHRLGYVLRVHLQATAGSTTRNEALSKIGYLYHCFRCLHRELRPGTLPTSSQECRSCGRPPSVAGPLWIGPLFDAGFCAKMTESAVQMSLARPREALSLLAASLAEASAPPTYFIPAVLCRKWGCPLQPRAELAAKVKNSGYSFVETHLEATGFRTDAPIDVILDALRAR